MWRINHQPHRSTFLCRLTLQTQTCRQNWGDISASIWWPEFWDLIWINLQRPCFQKTVQQLGLIVSYNTATSCSELQDFYITRPLWCLRAQFGLISCCQGQVGFFEDKGGLLYKERKKKNMHRGHGEIRCCTESFSLISRSHIRAGFVPSSKYRSECLKSYFGTFFRFFQSGDLACSFSTLLKRRFSSITTTFLLRLEPLSINCNIITPPTHTPAVAFTRILKKAYDVCKLWQLRQRDLHVFQVSRAVVVVVAGVVVAGWGGPHVESSGSDKNKLLARCCWFILATGRGGSWR